MSNQKLYSWDISKSQKKPKKLPTVFSKGNPNNVLIIGDIHEPFCLEGYLEFCREQQEKFNCGKIVFIGDIIDNHYSSYHETDPDGYSAGEEFERAYDKVQNWYKVFPEAIVLTGNHDRLIARKAYSAGISQVWIRSLKDTLNTTNWNFVEEYEYLDVLYMHGEGGTARTKMKKELQSIVQGHLHTQAYIEYIVGKHYKIFGFQVGCGIDKDAYAMAYAKRFPKPIISCGVVLNGQLPILLPMNL